MKTINASNVIIVFFINFFHDFYKLFLVIEFNFDASNSSLNHYNILKKWGTLV